VDDAQSVRFAVQERGGPATPGYLCRRTDTGSVRFTQVRVPNMGWVMARIDRPLQPDALCGSMVIRRDQLGRWWVTFQCEIPPPAREPTGEIIGVNRGVARPLVTDTGHMIQIPGFTPGEARRVLKLEKSLARKRRINPCRADEWVDGRLVRGRCECSPGECWRTSGRYRACRRAHLKLHHRRTARRRDACHKASHILADAADVVVFEALDLQRMVASARGTVDQPGVQVAAKRDLNRGFHDANPGRLREMTGYKTKVIEVNAVDISVTCSTCGHVDQSGRAARGRSFTCPTCGHVDDVDRNAAAVVRHRGEVELARASGPAATQAVAGRGGDRVERPDEPSTSTRSPGGHWDRPLSRLVPEHWGVRTDCHHRPYRRFRPPPRRGKRPVEEGPSP
jgi:transposase